MWWLKWHWVNFFFIFRNEHVQGQHFFFCFSLISMAFYFQILVQFFYFGNALLILHTMKHIYLRHIFLFINISSGIVVLCVLWYNKSLTVTCKYRTLIPCYQTVLWDFCICLQFTFELNSIRKSVILANF